jgi:hypothetical protein
MRIGIVVMLIVVLGEMIRMVTSYLLYLAESLLVTTIFGQVSSWDNRSATPSIVGVQILNGAANRE